MSFSLAAVVTAYDALGTLNAATASALSTLQGLGAYPTLPVDVAADADQNTVTTAQTTWLANQATYTAAYNTAVSAQKAGELAVTNLMLPNQWYKMTGLTNWGSHATQYISIRNPQFNSNADNLEGATLYTITTNRNLPTAHAPFV